MSGHDGKSDIRVYFCHNAVRGSDISSPLARLQSRPDIVVESVPCSGRIDPRYVLKAFEAGSRAVCVLACPSGHCKTMEGNLRAARRIQAVRELLTEAGLDPDSVQIFMPRDLEDKALNAALEGIERFGGGCEQQDHGVTE